MPLESITRLVHSHLTPIAASTPEPLLMVASMCVLCALLFAKTRGYEFIVCGLAGLIYFLPFVK